jgi:hypothetical protein
MVKYYGENLSWDYQNIAKELLEKGETFPAEIHGALRPGLHRKKIWDKEPTSFG